MVAACTTSGGPASDAATATSGGPSDAATATSEQPSTGTATSERASTTSLPSTPGTTSVTTSSTVATGLEVPWAIAFLPDGTALATLRDRGEVVRLTGGQAGRSLGRVPGVTPGGEGGLLGLAVSPTFARDHHLFVYLTAAGDNRVLRVTLDGDRLTDSRAILTGIPKAGRHNGGRLAFGPDGYLYVTTGDAGETAHAQDRGSLGGKILRVTQEGRPAPGNPFGDSPVWTYGHRNVQGIAWAPDGRMYASEFGQDTWDELNLIQPGRNYGWPTVEGRAGRVGLVDPLVQWPTSEASPSGVAVAGGAVYLAALRGESLWRVPLQGNGVGRPERLLHGRYGRLRDVVLGPDHRLWLLTSNTFRGDPRPGDDHVLALPLSAVR